MKNPQHETNAPIRFEDLEDGEMPVQEEQSPSIPIAEAPDDLGVRGAIGVRADTVLTETPPGHVDDVSL